MCANHHLLFDAYGFFIRFFPDVTLIGPNIYRKLIRKFVFVNYSGKPSLQQFHGKAIALDIRDRHAPFPSTFIIHETRVRGFHPFRPVAPAMPDDSPWQDWIPLESGVLDNTQVVSIVTAHEAVAVMSLRSSNSRFFSLQQRVQAAHRLADAR
jgi:hypothetical protein